jgi:hypothetical protein
MTLESKSIWLWSAFAMATQPPLSLEEWTCQRKVPKTKSQRQILLRSMTNSFRILFRKPNCSIGLLSENWW